ncbi:DNA replication/repair protein RecF [Treponema brennaborense]|uniref:DNA replication and repair protein RecF n=1 Tax=Treponema brennaborense (strain DSM 12168 / CIP 105900 / DD5/3) TaxID=906968 RepID=F4LK74_TREBD|nr:DNA replication and repair protein RecF [Treponema brennaborense]AEE15463.1 DNA replication and repair protein recF [Treponema brennaborense DSM 12168]
MPFLSLSCTNFRNLKNDKIDLLSKEVYFVGENGQGKSNLLEALYYASYASSFRTHNEQELVRYDEKAFSIRTLFREENDSVVSMSILFENGKKTIQKNAKKITDRKELVNAIPCVLFCHDDLDFAVGEPERRRFFIDQSLSMYDALYIDEMRRFKKVLKSRNLVLKNQQYDMLDAYDTQLAQNGLYVQYKRKKMIFTFNGIFTALYEKVTGIDGVTISYEPSWKETSHTVPDVDSIVDLLKNRRSADMMMGTTMSGPHRDRIRFIRGGKPFIPTASTGQRRLASILLRAAQAVYYTEITGRKPVLLMDDVLLELDPDKRQKVTALLPPYDQLFCTFLPGEPYERYRRSDTRVYFIENGEWHE